MGVGWDLQNMVIFKACLCFSFKAHPAVGCFILTRPSRLPLACALFNWIGPALAYPTFNRAVRC
jgi:hypothetical protein